MPDPIRSRIEAYSEAPAAEHEVDLAAESVIRRGRRRLRRRRTATAGLLVLIVVSGATVAAALDGDRGSGVTTVGSSPSATTSTTDPISFDEAEPDRSFGLTHAQEQELATEHQRSLETCVHDKGFEMTIDTKGSQGAGGLVVWGHPGLATAPEMEALEACSDAASEQEVEDRDRMLRENGNPIVTLQLAACPALEDVVVRGDLPARFDTERVEGKAGGIPLNTCFGDIEADGAEPGIITVSEGMPDDPSLATEDRGTYRVGVTGDGFVAVYTSDQLPSHYIEATGVTAQEFDTLVQSLQPD